MPVLQKYLVYQVPLPQTKIVWMPSEKRAFTAMSYPKIEGKCVGDTFTFSQKERSFKIKFFEQLSDAVSQLHHIPIKALPLQVPTKEEGFRELFFSDTLQRGAFHLKSKIIQTLFHDSFLGLGKSASHVDILAHSDLHSGNVLLNDRNELVGLLDFDTLGRGDRFWEFRPYLYEDSQDTLLFREIYSSRTGYRIDPKDFYAMHQLFYFGKLLATAFTTYDALSPTQNIKRLKHHFQNKEKMMEAIQNSFRSL